MGGMNTEVEVKFLDTDHDEMRERLQAAGATLERPKRSMRRVVLDFPDNRLKERDGWLRIRDEGYTVKMTYKQLDTWSPSGVRAAEVVVAGFDAAKNVLEAVGMEAKAYQESKAETWRLGDVRVVLSEWPFVRPFLELEGQSEAELKKAAKALHLHWKDVVTGGIEPVYMAEYDIDEEYFRRINDLTFIGTAPQLLETRRRKKGGKKKVAA